MFVPTSPTPSAPSFHPAMLRRGLGQTASCPQPWTNVSIYAQTSADQCPKPTTQNGSQIPVATEAGQIAGAAGSIGATVLALSPTTGPAAPFVAIAGLLTSFMTGVLHIGVGCGATCVEATAVAQYAECIMHTTVNTYMNAPVHYASAQAAALAVFNAAWQYLTQVCNQIGGQGGKGCIQDRQRGGKYDQFACCYDPIANDPCVVPDPTPVDVVTGATTTVEGAASSAVTAIEQTFSSVLGTSSSSLLIQLLIGGAILLLVGGSL